MTPEAAHAAEQLDAALKDIKTLLLPALDGNHTQNVEQACQRLMDARAALRSLMREINAR